MEKVSQHWLDTNADAFTAEGQVQLTIYHTNNNALILNDAWITKFRQDINGSILSGSLPENKIVVTLDNSGGEFEYDPEYDLYKNNQAVYQYGFAQYLDDGEGGYIKVYDSIRGARLFVYSATFDEDAKTVTLDTRDILSFMTETYTGIQRGNGYEMALAAIMQAESSAAVPLAEITTVFDVEALSAADIVIPYGKYYSIRDLLQIIANAAMCVIYVDRRSGIHIEKLTDISGTYIDRTRTWGTAYNSGMTWGDALAYTWGSRFAYQRYNINRSIQYGSVKQDLQPKISHFSLIYANNQRYAELHMIGEDGQEETLANELLANDPEETFHVNYVGLWVYHTLQSGRIMYTGSIRPDPRADLFDLVYVQTKTGYEPCIITGMSLDYNGGWTGTFKAISADFNDITDIYSLETYRIIDLEAYTLNELEGG